MKRRAFLRAAACGVGVAAVPVAAKPHKTTCSGFDTMGTVCGECPHGLSVVVGPHDWCDYQDFEAFRKAYGQTHKGRRLLEDEHLSVFEVDEKRRIKQVWRRALTGYIAFAGEFVSIAPLRHL